MCDGGTLVSAKLQASVRPERRADCESSGPALAGEPSVPDRPCSLSDRRTLATARVTRAVRTVVAAGDVAPPARLRRTPGPRWKAMGAARARCFRAPIPGCAVPSHDEHRHREPARVPRLFAATGSHREELSAVRASADPPMTERSYRTRKALAALIEAARNAQPGAVVGTDAPELLADA